MEVMIVIAIIGLLASVLTVKMGDSLNKGKAFKTEIAISKLYDVLSFADVSPPLTTEKVEEAVKDSPFVRDLDSVLKDGWGEPFTLAQDGTEIRFSSSRYDAYCAKKSEAPKYPWQQEEKEEAQEEKAGENQNVSN